MAGRGGVPNSIQYVIIAAVWTVVSVVAQFALDVGVDWQIRLYGAAGVSLVVAAIWKVVEVRRAR